MYAPGGSVANRIWMRVRKNAFLADFWQYFVRHSMGTRPIRLKLGYGASLVYPKRTAETDPAICVSFLNGSLKTVQKNAFSRFLSESDDLRTRETADRRGNWHLGAFNSCESRYELDLEGTHSVEAVFRPGRGRRSSLIEFDGLRSCPIR